MLYLVQFADHGVWERDAASAKAGATKATEITRSLISSNRRPADKRLRNRRLAVVCRTDKNASSSKRSAGDNATVDTGLSIRSARSREPAMGQLDDHSDHDARRTSEAESSTS